MEMDDFDEMTALDIIIKELDDICSNDETWDYYEISHDKKDIYIYAEGAVIIRMDDFVADIDYVRKDEDSLEVFEGHVIDAMVEMFEDGVEMFEIYETLESTYISADILETLTTVKMKDISYILCDDDILIETGEPRGYHSIVELCDLLESPGDYEYELTKLFNKVIGVGLYQEDYL